MFSPNFIQTTVGLIFGVFTLLKGQSPCTDACRHSAPPADSAAAATTVASEMISPSGKSRFWEHLEFTGGQLTLPFKIRPKAETESFRLTTDVTVGGFVGMTKRLSSIKEIFLTIPLAAGLTFINLNNDNTFLDKSVQEAEVVPGITWSTGLILQLEKYSLGFMLGKDYASEVGNQWKYHGRVWWSFGIGFTFVREE